MREAEGPEITPDPLILLSIRRSRAFWLSAKPLFESVAFGSFEITSTVASAFPTFPVRETQPAACGAGFHAIPRYPSPCQVKKAFGVPAARSTTFDTLNTALAFRGTAGVGSEQGETNMWTKETPKTPGWYWCSAENGSRPEAVELKHINGRIEERDGYLLEDFSFRWAPMASPEDAAARNIGLGLAFVGYYYIGESIGALAVVPVLVEEIERS